MENKDNSEDPNKRKPTPEEEKKEISRMFEEFKKLIKQHEIFGVTNAMQDRKRLN